MSDLRLIIFLLLLALFIGLQHWQPRRSRASQPSAMFSNFGLVLSSSALLWLLLPAGAIGASLWAEQADFGLLRLTNLTPWLSAGIAIVALDMAIYWQHRAMHRWSLLWRLHRVHHSDLAFESTTGLRFHPLEILLSMLYKMAVVCLLGASAEAVLIYEILLSSFALFNHSNWAMPADAWLRKLVVTPDVHRVHHSVIKAETNSNYGNFLLLWDRLFGSYRPQPQNGHVNMQIGLQEYRDRRSQKLLFLLLNPFRQDR